MLAIIATSILAAPHKMPAQTDTLTFTTPSLPSPEKVTVVVPSSYLTPTDTTHYPVVYLLNGYSGNHTDYARHMNLDSLANVHSAIFVCPDGRDTWYWDAPADPKLKMETFFTKELVKSIDHQFRTRPCRTQRAIVGLSMGGHGALWLAMRHSDIWANGGAMSGGVDITRPQFHKNWKMALRLGTYQSNPKRWADHTVVNLVNTLHPGQLNIIFACGTDDFFYQANCDLDTRLNNAKIPHTYITAPGAHTWQYWQTTLPLILDYFTTQFRK